MTNTDRPAIAIVADPITTSQARSVKRVAPVAADSAGFVVGPATGSVKATTNAAIVEPTAIKTNGARQPQRLISTATIGPPIKSANAQDVSKMPIDLARRL